MKIAMIVPYPIFPPDEGGRMRAYNLLKHLSAHHEMSLFTPRSPANAAHGLRVRLFETTPPGRRHQILDAGFLRRAPAIAREELPDVILAEFIWPGLHAAYLARRLGVPFVLDAHNVEADRFRSSASRAQPLVAVYERLIARLASGIFVVSPEDGDRFRGRGVPAAKIQAVPNGVDPDAVHPDAEAGMQIRRELGIGENTKMLLFFGQLGYAPNRDAMRIIHQELLPRLDHIGLDYRFVVAGKNHEQAAWLYSHPRLRYTGAVAAIAPYVNAADTVAVPIVSGGGTRLKILESIACATSVVSTSAGAEGIDRAACGRLLTIEDGWDGFAAALASPRDVKSGNVPAPFLDMYSWANIVSRIEWPRRGR
ncbi:MAG: glycosyltransferase family 4 protein [Chloroflexi bacterium]|nr:glycosyltransferase family 4 protein [Chloroflexota bacterium]